MNLCSNDHTEICYEGHVCPLCLALETKNNDINDQYKKITELENKIDELEEALSTKLRF